MASATQPDPVNTAAPQYCRSLDIKYMYCTVVCCNTNNNTFAHNSYDEFTRVNQYAVDEYHKPT